MSFILADSYSYLKVIYIKMTILQGRILITDYSNKEERDAVIENILNHELSRAALYILIKDFEDIPSLLNKFPTVIPLVLNPQKNIEETRKLLELLPHMNHFVNFLGQQMALEFLERRDDLRIKDISMTYAKTVIVDKALESNEEGIIFNVHTDDNVLDVLVPTKKSVQTAVKKIFSGSSTGPSSAQEKQKLLSSQEENDNGESSTSVGYGTRNQTTSDSSRQPNLFWRVLVFLFHLCCPYLSGTNVKLPVKRYPPDLDKKMMDAFRRLYASIGSKWYEKLENARIDKKKEIENLNNRKQKLKEKEFYRLKSTRNYSSNQTSDPILAKRISESNEKADLSNATLNVREIMIVEKNKIEEKYSLSLRVLYAQQYDNIIAQQIQTLKSVWNKLRLAI